MTTYFETKGQKIQVLSSDPPTSIVGQVWYNSTSDFLKFNKIIGASFSSGGSMLDQRGNGGIAGTQTAAVLFGGFKGFPSPTPPPNYKVQTELYNGTAWTRSGNMATGRVLGNSGFGVQTAAVAAGGFRTPPFNGYLSSVEEFNGSTWTGGGALPSARQYNASVGIESAGLTFGGTEYPGPIATTDKYNGSTWTNTGSLTNARRKLGGAGTQTAGLAFGGIYPGTRNITEEFNGSTWASGGTMTKEASNISGCGIQTNAVSFNSDGPYPNPLDYAACLYDGTTWTNSANNPNTSASAGKSAGSVSAALIGNLGLDPAFNEFSGTPVQQAVTVSMT
jgi:hypothetical protein